MRRLVLSCSLVLLAACAKQEAAPEPGAMSAGASGPLTHAAVAGRWAMQTKVEGSDVIAVSFEMNAGSDASGWTFTFPGRDPVPVRVIALEGDSIVTEAGPYESALRPGVQVSTHSVMRMQAGMLVGRTVARYATTTPDSVLTLETEGTRIP